jgi:GPI mannosyltransferase 3
VLALRRDGARLRDAALVLTLGAFAYGLLDRLTWGGWFHSARVYLAFNLQGGAEAWGTAPFSYYGRVLLQAMPGVALAGAGLALLSLRRAPALFALTCAFLLLHALQPHKELRFLVPALPLLAASAGVGLEALLARLRAPPARAALALALAGVALHSAWAAPRLTFGDVGQYEDSRPRASAWDDAGSVNRLLARAGKEPDLCGLKVEVAHLAWTGGYSYLHRPVPLYPHYGPPRWAGRYNFVITWKGAAAGAGELRASDGALALVRLQRPGCVADAGFSWRLD